MNKLTASQLAVLEQNARERIRRYKAGELKDFDVPREHFDLALHGSVFCRFNREGFDAYMYWVEISPGDIQFRVSIATPPYNEISSAEEYNQHFILTEEGLVEL